VSCWGCGIGIDHFSWVDGTKFNWKLLQFRCKLHVARCMVHVAPSSMPTFNLKIPLVFVAIEQQKQNYKRCWLFHIKRVYVCSSSSNNKNSININNMRAMMKNRLQHVWGCWAEAVCSSIPSHSIPSTSPTPIQALAPTARWQLWHQLQLQKYTQASLLWFLVFLFIFYIFNMGSLMSCGLNTKNIPIRMLGNLVPSANQEYAVTKKIIEYITPY